MTDRPATTPAPALLPVQPAPAAEPTRRRVLVAGGVVAAAAAVTTACGSSSGTAGTPAASDTSAGSGSSAGGAATIPTSDVPVGGGTVLADRQIVVTQPSAGEFKAFSAVCTHQGCIVAGVTNGVIVCPCHGSTYSIADGSVQGGPAPAPLPAETITVSGGTITLP
ncbi:MAG: Rieske 2Fe-2S domain-containing protein [Frankiales bacterium]|nr:Rieske 2Fe-2S domain-containing protein [Frankiales bacterium]